MIARARDEVEVAETLLGRVVAEYADTRAAPRAKEALEAPAVPSGAESEAVQVALADLRDVLLATDPNEVSLKRIKAVFRTLSAEQIAAECRRQGEMPVGFLHTYGTRLRSEHAEKMVELLLLLADDEQTVRTVIRALPHYGVEPLPERTYDLVRTLPPIHDERLFHLFGSLDEERAMAALQTIAERSPEILEWSRRDDSAFSALLHNRHPVAGEVFGLVMDTVGHTPEGPDGLGDFLSSLGDHAREVGRHPLCLRSPGAEHLRPVFELIPPGRRSAIAWQLADQGWEDPPRAVLDLVLADPEADVRVAALVRMVRSADPAWGEEALERMVREETATQWSVLENAVRTVDPAWPLEPLLDAAEGVLREIVYSVALTRWGRDYERQGRNGLGALRIGLDRKDPELYAALFAPSDEYLRLTEARPGEGVIGNVSTALQQASGASGKGLAARLIFAAQASPDERVRHRAHELAWKFLGPEERVAYQEKALRDPSPRVRHDALEGGLEGVSPETVAALIGDPDGWVFDRALMNTPEPAALIFALESLSEHRQHKGLGHAKSRDQVEVVRAQFEHCSARGWWSLAEEAFDILRARDPDVLISGVTHASGRVRREALQQLASLELPDDVRDRVIRLYGADYESPDEQRALRLRAMSTEVARALQGWNVERLETLLAHQSARHALAAELASLGERERLLEYLLHTDKQHREVGALGLVLLEDREAMRQGLRDCLVPFHLLPHAVELGLWEDCAELVREGRLNVGDLISTLHQANRREELARFLLGESSPVCDRVNADVLTAMVGAAADLRDAAMLSRAAERFDSGAAVSVLLELGELERILEDLPRWGHSARAEAVVELNRRTGETARWPKYATEQAAVLARWREKLGLPERGSR